MVLPAARPGQKIVTISPIEGGSITLPERFFVHPADPEARRTVPSLSFLITHPDPPAPVLAGLPGKRTAGPLRILFDLGLRASATSYPAPQQAHLDSRRPYKLEPGVAKKLRAGGREPTDIDVVILSHVHYDHHGDPADFPRALFIVGSGAMTVLKDGLGGLASHQHFEPDLLPEGRSVEIAPQDAQGSALEMLGCGPWKRISNIDAFDLLGDGSMFVVDAPGHLPGHVSLLCRVGVEPSVVGANWVLLAGDTAHDPRLLTGEKAVGTWIDDHGREMCIHLDKAAAERSIARARALAEAGVEVVVAHDADWAERHRSEFFPATLQF